MGRCVGHQEPILLQAQTSHDHYCINYSTVHVSVCLIKLSFWGLPAELLHVVCAEHNFVDSVCRCTCNFSAHVVNAYE